MSCKSVLLPFAAALLFGCAGPTGPNPFAEHFVAAPGAPHFKPVKGLVYEKFKSTEHKVPSGGSLDGFTPAVKKAAQTMTFLGHSHFYGEDVDSRHAVALARSIGANVVIDTYWEPPVSHADPIMVSVPLTHSYRVDTPTDSQVFHVTSRERVPLSDLAPDKEIWTAAYFHADSIPDEWASSLDDTYRSDWTTLPPPTDALKAQRRQRYMDQASVEKSDQYWRQMTDQISQSRP